MRKFNYDMMMMHDLLMSTQERLLFKKLPAYMNALKYADIEFIGDCLFAHGNIPVMLVAHCDIVHKKATAEAPDLFVYDYEEKDGIVQTFLSANNRTLGADDRAGVYIILKTIEALEKKGLKPYVLFTSDEEIGCVGASKFVKAMPSNEYDIKMVIELDRKGSNDIVFYDCDDDKEFVDFMVEKTGYKHALGSYSDIVEISDAWGVCSCNLSCGYYSEHTQSEYLIVEEMLGTLGMLVGMLEKLDYNTLPAFIHTPMEKVYDSYWDSWDYPQETVEGYISCADCGDLVPVDNYDYLDEDKYGIPLCEACRKYYDMLIEKDYYDDEELSSMKFVDEEPMSEEELDKFVDSLYNGKGL